MRPLQLPGRAEDAPAEAVPHPAAHGTAGSLPTVPRLTGMLLEGKAAIVTGASGSTGRACATRFAWEGADVLLLDFGSDRDPVPPDAKLRLDHTVARCRDLGADATGVWADAGDPRTVTAAVEEAVDRFGSLDILVNGAGITAPSDRALHRIGEDEWRRMLDTDVSVAWRMMKAVAPFMVAQRSGSIVNVASTAGVLGYRHSAARVAGQHALIGLTKAAALDYAPSRIRVNAVCPATVRDQPLIEADEVAGSAVWLAGDDSRQVTGTVVVLDGVITAG